MKRDAQKALLAAAGRYIRRMFGEVEPRIKAVEDRVAEIPALVEKAAESLPKPKDGTSVTAEDVAPLLQRMVEAMVPEAPEPVDVQAVSAEAAKHLLVSEGLRSICDLVVTEAVAKLPPAEKGEPGKSVTADEVAAALLPRLQESFEASAAKHLLDVERRAQGILERAVAAIPKPKEGRDGVDGLGFDDMTASYDGERSVTLKFERGERTKEFTFRLPVTIDKGYWREGTKAEAGDGWTHDGCWWIAKADTDTKPGYDSPAWRMGARKGRDGQSNAPAPAGPSGPVKL